jgi:hypothetical protein
MINLVYSQNSNNNGPGKVVINLKKGLELLNINYTENNFKIDAPSIFLQEHPVMYEKNLSMDLVGPNICVLPVDNKIIFEQNYKKCIVPSQWVYNKYKTWIDSLKLSIWPVGIDVDEFIPNDKKTIDFLIYFKRRSIEELQHCCNVLNENGLTYMIVSYGQYEEKQFKNILDKCKYAIIIDNCESQGIAIQEIMSCNLPLLVWDVELWQDRGIKYTVEATSIPYFDETCGLSFKNKILFEKILIDFLNKVTNFNPRNYILSNFTLQKQALNLMKEFI